MKLRNIGSNMVEVDGPLATILFSYSTPVAACMSDGSGFVRTDKRWSVTTTRHINKWLAGARAEERPQSYFDGLTDERRAA